MRRRRVTLLPGLEYSKGNFISDVTRRLAFPCIPSLLWANALARLASALRQSAPADTCQLRKAYSQRSPKVTVGKDATHLDLLAKQFIPSEAQMRPRNKRRLGRSVSSAGKSYLGASGSGAPSNPPLTTTWQITDDASSGAGTATRHRCAVETHLHRVHAQFGRKVPSLPP